MPNNHNCGTCRDAGTVGMLWWKRACPACCGKPALLKQLRAAGKAFVEAVPSAPPISPPSNSDTSRVHVTTLDIFPEIIMGHYVATAQAVRYAWFMGTHEIHTETMTGDGHRWVNLGDGWQLIAEKPEQPHTVLCGEGETLDQAKRRRCCGDPKCKDRL